MFDRDPSVLQAALATPFNGYATQRRKLVPGADTDRVAALVAILATMVISGVVLGGRSDATRV